MSTDPMDGHSVISLMGIVFVAAVLAVGLTAYATITLVRMATGRMHSTSTNPARARTFRTPHVLRATASLAGAGARVVYAWGARLLLALAHTERGAALALPRALEAGLHVHRTGGSPDEVVAAARQVLKKEAAREEGTGDRKIGRQGSKGH